MSDLHIILASGSPRRKDILNTIGLSHDIRIADIDETPFDGEVPEVYVQRLAYKKVMAAADAAAQSEVVEIIVGGDTIVVLDGEILQKPVDETEACEMLRRLKGRRHQVLTGISVYHSGRDEAYTGLSVTEVEMTAYSDETIKAYIATGEPMDKAGAYGIQGIGAVLVSEVFGDYNTVVGLPVSTLMTAFETLDINYFDLLKIQ